VTIIPLQIKDPENVSKEEEDKNKQREFLLAGFYHIDLWAKFLDSNTLLMPEFSEEQIEELPYDHDREKIRILNQFLADAEDKILKAKSGLTVSRLNVPLSYTKRSRIEEDRFVHPSYINSALIVGSEKRIALVPRFNQGTDLKYRDYQLFPAMEKKVRETFEEAGYEVVWVDSDPFPQFHSGIHCLTRNIPKI
jgi:agmatine/peptidylarginine deiminase